MGVQLREKKMSNGQISYYLDIYHEKKRWYEFLDIHITKNRPTEEDKEKKRLAQEIRSKRENELIVQDNGLIDKSKRKGDFVEWFTKYMKDRNLNNSHNKSTLSNLKKYLGKRSLPFTVITAEWLVVYSRHLLSKMSNNSARIYLINMSTALEDAVRADIIPINPFRKIPRHEKIRQKPTSRQAFTFEDLQKLSDTECKIKPQIRQGYFFSCFTGLRWSDVNPMKWSEIIIKKIDGREEWFIYFEQEKTEGVEYLPLSEQAVEILKERKKESIENDERSIYVFPEIKEYSKDNYMNFKVNKALKKWAKAAGINPELMHFHTGRHTFATNVLENSPDGDLYTVSKLLGHKNIQATQIYAHIRDNKKRDAVRSLPKLIFKIQNPAA